MSNAYQPFLISEFKTGLYNYLEPWVRPSDAFEPLVNAYVYRGELQKRNGSTIFGNQLADTQPVMGIMQYQNESSGVVALIIASEDFLYIYTPGSTPDGGTFNKITSVSESPFWTGPVTAATVRLPASGELPTFWTNLTPSSVSIKAYDEENNLIGTVTDNGTSGWATHSGIFTGTGSINLTTGVVDMGVTITTSFTLSLRISCTLPSATPYFTGTIANFFNWTNWQPTSSATSISTSYLYVTNNVDSVTLVDASNPSSPTLSRPAFYVDSASTKRVTKALDVKTYNNRLLLMRPTITGEINAANQDIYYSATFNPFDFIADIAGHGGFISAATGDQIMNSRFLRDVLIVGFSNSHWTFQISGVYNPPFIFRRLNVSKSIKCPYAPISYDERVTNLGNNGFVACDGVNVQRYDVPIIDYYETQISQQYFNQDFSIRYDNLNQTLMYYPSYNVLDINPVVDSVAPGSDEQLVYNFLENTWATYKNSFPMTCMGLFNVTSGTTWEQLTIPWGTTGSPWSSYSTQSASPLLLAGDTSGHIYHLDNSIAVRDGQGDASDQIISIGNGGTTYSGTLYFHPIEPGSLTITDGVETFTDTGQGGLIGDMGGTGTINYTTGAWTLIFNAAVTVDTPIVADYVSLGVSFNVDIETTRWNPFMQMGQKTQFGYIDVYYKAVSVNPEDPIQVTLDFYVDNSNAIAASRTLTFDAPSIQITEVIDTGDGISSSYAGFIARTGYIVPFSFSVVVTTSDGEEVFEDNGLGVLQGDLGDTGTIEYDSGDWTINFGVRTVPSGNEFVATYDFNDTQTNNWKRVYCNLIGEFIKIQIDPSEDAPFGILGFVLWARPAGRLTP